MKKISEHLGEIIVALAGICLIIMAVVMFRAPVGAFFTNSISKLTGIGTQVLANVESPDFNPEPGDPEATPDGTYSYEWAPMTWNGDNKNFGGRLVWTDGTNYYYSRAFDNTNNVQYVLNQETNTWEEKTWEGCTWFMGDDVWTDGTNIYLSKYDSNASYSNRYQHYVLQDGKWVKKTWNYTSFTGSYIWNTKNFAFYCNGETQIALQNGQWLNAANAFTGLDSFFGNYVWTDGTSFYYSFVNTQYKLNGWNWEEITWEGLTDGMDGCMVWTDGENMYYSLVSSQFKLNTETLTAEPVTWTGISDEIYGVCGADVWTDGTNIYFSELDFDGEVYQYVLQRTAVGTEPSTPNEPEQTEPEPPESTINRSDLFATWTSEDEEYELLLEELGGKLYRAGDTREIGMFSWKLEGNTIILNVMSARGEAEYILEEEAIVAEDASSIVLGGYTFILAS